METRESPSRPGDATSPGQALAQLIWYSKTSRAQLVAACWKAGLTNIAALATAAGVTRQVIYDDLSSQNIDPRDRPTPAAPAKTLIVDQVTFHGGDSSQWEPVAQAPWHHPHFHARIDQHPYRRTYQFRQFTGREERPDLPKEWWTWPDAQREAAREESNAAEQLWLMARFRDAVTPHLTNAVAYAQAFHRALKELDAAWSALQDAPDTGWRSAVTKLVKAQDTARDHAPNWFAIVGELDDIMWTYPEHVFDQLGGWKGIAREKGIDDDVWPPQMDADDFEGQLDEQDRCIRKVRDLTTPGC